MIPDYPLTHWREVPEHIKQKARELCAEDDNDPDGWTEGGYGPGYSEDGNHTAAYSEEEPLWWDYVDDAIEALSQKKPVTE